MSLKFGKDAIQGDDVVTFELGSFLGEDIVHCGECALDGLCLRRLAVKLALVVVHTVEIGILDVGWPTG